MRPISCNITTDGMDGVDIEKERRNKEDEDRFKTYQGL